MTIYSIRHETTYRYARPVAFGVHRLLLRPRDGFDQRTLDARLDVSPAPATVSWAEDAFGNIVGTARMPRRARELRFVSTVTVEVSPIDPAVSRARGDATRLPIRHDAGDGGDLSRFLERRYADPDRTVEAWMRPLLAADADVLQILRSLNDAVGRTCAYQRREEHGTQSPATTLRLRSGSCRDFAVLMMDAARSVGLASRFVSGYLHVRPTGRHADVARASMHAWAQVHVPGAGWIDLDPTTGTVGNDGLIRTAVACEPEQAVPLSGTFTGFADDALGMSVDVRVERRSEKADESRDLRLSA